MQFSENNQHRDYFIERFEIPAEIMRKYTFWERGKRVWAFTGEIFEIRNIEIIGIKALTLGATPKPSTAFLRIVGKYAKRNYVDLSNEDALKFLKGEDILRTFPVEQGYVVVRHGEDVLGCGLYKGKLLSQIPKKYRFAESWI